MFRAPKGRKRQFRKNRCVLITRRAPGADTTAEGNVKYDGITMRIKPTGVEHRESVLMTENRGAGRSGCVMLMLPGGARHIHDCCTDLLRFFGHEWCLLARFANCRFTVAEVLLKCNDGVALNDCVRDSTESITVINGKKVYHGSWMVSVPYGVPTFDPYWCQWGPPTITSDFSSDKYHMRSRKFDKRKPVQHDKCCR